MADNAFNTNPGTTVDREMMIAYLNTGTSSAPVWSPLGKRVEDSSMELDWQTETKVDIFGDTYTTGKKATRTQSFEPCELDSSDAAQQKIWELGIKDNNVNALLNQDVMVAHFYAGGTSAGTNNFAERYEGCSVLPTGLGGEGGGSMGMPIEITFGGKRTTGTISKDEAGKYSFTEDTASATRMSMRDMKTSEI